MALLFFHMEEYKKMLQSQLPFSYSVAALVTR